MRWPKIVTPLPGPKAREVLALDARYMSPSLTRLYPFVADHGDGCWIWDVDGNLFLDFTAGIGVSTVGYGPSKVAAAIERQAPRLLHFTIADFYHQPAAQVAAELAALFPSSRPARVFLCNSGAETIETALKLARYHTRRTRLAAFTGAFHGRTTGALALSASKPIHKDGFGSLLDGVVHVPFSLAGLEELETRHHPEELAAIFVEPIQGEAGVNVPGPEFLPALRALCDRHGIMLVADEVQTGMGRTGKMFACEHWDVVPDILCIAKGIASGMPLGAVVAKAEIMAWPSGTHTSTFGGNPVSCVAALATIELLKSSLIGHTRAMGDLLMRGVRQIAEKNQLVADVRGKGLLIGMELQRERTPATAERDAILRQAFQHGLLLLGGGLSIVRLEPPLIVNSEEIEVGLELLDAAFAETLHHKQAA